MTHTLGPWEKAGPHQKGSHDWGTPKAWTYVQHNFPDYPYEGDLEDEYGIYPPLGESGPVALVSGRDNADLMTAAPDLLAACKEALEILADYTDIDWLVTQLLTAIKKAEGESNVSMA